MSNYRKSTPRGGPKDNPRRGTLTSGVSLSRRQRPSPAAVRSALNCLYKAAEHMEQNTSYADQISIECLDLSYRLDLLRTASVLVFKNATAETVWDATEHFLVPLITGLCEGQYETGNIIGTGMIGSDGCDHLRELARDEGEPLSRIIDAIARFCPQKLYGLRESSND